MSAVIETPSALLDHIGPGAQGVCWDMAMRGTHKTQLYKQLGLIPVIKTVKAPGGYDKTAQLGRHRFSLAHGTTRFHEVFTQAGTPVIEVIVSGKRVPVVLTRTRTRRVRQRTSGYRWFNDYVVPDDAPAPQWLRGASVSIRLNQSNQHAPNHNRAEVISTISERNADWQRLYACRPVAESVNSLIKRAWYRNRAPRIGAARNHISLLCAAIWNNYRAWTEYSAATRTRTPPTTPLPDATPSAQNNAVMATDANAPPQTADHSEAA